MCCAGTVSAEKGVMEAQVVCEGKKKELDEVTRQALDEFENFKRTKQRDLHRVMCDFVKMQIDHSRKQTQAWEALLPEIEHLNNRI